MNLKIFVLVVLAATAWLLPACGGSSMPPGPNKPSDPPTSTVGTNPTPDPIQHPVPDPAQNLCASIPCQPGQSCKAGKCEPNAPATMHCAQWQTMSELHYRCNNPLRTEVQPKLQEVAGGCQASDPNLFTGLIVATMPDPIPENSWWVVITRDDMSGGQVKSFTFAYHEQGVVGQTICREL